MTTLLQHAGDGTPASLHRPFWWHDRLVAPPSVRRFVVGERSVLFCERRQQMFELNGTADLIWLETAKGRSAGAAGDGLVAAGVSARQAEEFVETAIVSWLEDGLLTPASIVDRSETAGRVHLHIGRLACGLDIDVDDRPDAASPLRAMITSTFSQFLVEPEAVAVKIAVVGRAEHYFLSCDGEPMGMYPSHRIVAELKALLTARLSMSGLPGEIFLHGALLDTGGVGILFCGEPGAGKTTLSLALAARGWGYGADDVVCFTATDGFEGMGFSPAAKAGAWPLLDHDIPGLSQWPIHIRRDGQHVRYVPVEHFAGGRPNKVGWGVLLARTEGAAASLEPIDPLLFLTELIGGGFATDQVLHATALAALVEHVGAMSCRRLIYSDLSAAVALLRGNLDD